VDNSLPPLLRGIGASVILVSAVVTAIVVEPGQPVRATLAPGARPSATRESSIAEEVLVNPWFDLAGLLGSVIITGSFFAEWKIRRSGWTRPCLLGRRTRVAFRTGNPCSMECRLIPFPRRAYRLRGRSLRPGDRRPLANSGSYPCEAALESGGSAILLPNPTLQGGDR